MSEATWRTRAKRFAREAAAFRARCRQLQQAIEGELALVPDESRARLAAALESSRGRLEVLDAGSTAGSRPPHSDQEEP